MTRLIEIFHKIEEAGGQATLTVTTQGGKTKTTFETESPPSATNFSPPTSWRRSRRRRRVPTAKSRLADQQAASQVAEDTTSVPLDPSLSSTSPTSTPSSLTLTGRRRVMSLWRPAEITSFANLNLDGHYSQSSPPLPLPPPTPPPLPMAHDILEKLQRFDSVGEVDSSRKSPHDDECVHLHDHFPGEKVVWTGKCKAGNEQLFHCGGPPPSKLPILS